MSKQIREINQVKKSRIKEVGEEIEKIKGANQELIEQGQELQKKLAENNTNILRKEGALEELKRQVK